MLRKKNSKAVYREKCEEAVHSERQKLKYSFENFIHKNKAWDSYSDEFKAEYQALHKEFVKQSAEMLRRFEKEGGSELKSMIMSYLYDTDSKREELESRAKEYFLKS